MDVGVSQTDAPAKRLDIQGMRALALIIILAYHARAPLAGGFIALDLFFVISGFVIVQMLIREHQKTGGLNLGLFYRKRFRRLTPALAVTITAVCIAAILLQSPFGAQQTTAATAAGGMLLTANAVIAATTGNYFAAAAEQNPLLNIWSLSTEEQFYLVFPSLIILGWFIGRRRGWPSHKSVIVVVGVLASISFVLAVATSGQTLHWPFTSVLGYYGAAGRAWEFAAGALLGVLATRLARMPGRVAEVLAMSGVLIISLGIVGLRSTVDYPGVATLIPVAGASAIIAAGCSRHTRVSRTLSIRPMVFIGDMSYSWYLWHWPFIVFAISLWPQRPFLAPIVAVLCSFVPSWVTYRFVELPIRSRSTGQGQRNLILFALCFGLPLAFAGLLAFGAQHTWWQEWKRPSRYTEALSYPCHDTAFDAARCTWPVPHARGRVFLVGDSTALALSDGVVNADQQLGLETSVSSHSQCPLIAADHLRFPYREKSCARWQRTILNVILRTKPDLVVISNRPYVFDMTSGVQLIDEGHNVVTGQASVSTWTAALNEVVISLRRAGISVLIAEPPPETTYEIPSNGLLQRSRIRATYAEALERRRVAFAADEGVARQNPGTTMFDPLSVLCGPVECPDIVNGESLYADSRHLSIAGSMRLVEPLRSAIESSIVSLLR